MADRLGLYRILFCLLACPASSAFAEELPDPTRPPASIAAPVATGGVTEIQPAGLQTVIIAKNRRAAIIDGETVELGKKHGDARLIEVNEGSVVLQGAQGRQVLTLLPDVKFMKKEVKIKQVKIKHKSPTRKKQVGQQAIKPVVPDEKPLMEPLAVPPGSQTTATEQPVISEQPQEDK